MALREAAPVLCRVMSVLRGGQTFGRARMGAGRPVASFEDLLGETLASLAIQPDGVLQGLDGEHHAETIDAGAVPVIACHARSSAPCCKHAEEAR